MSLSNNSTCASGGYSDEGVYRSVGLGEDGTSGDCCSSCSQGELGGGTQFDPVLMRDEEDAPSALDEQAPLMTDWPLVRKFATFWPANADGPTALPWLGTIVSRRKAWRWVSQFPQRFATVEVSDLPNITAFISETLAGVEPEGVTSEKGDKGCCKPAPPAPRPPVPPDHPNVPAGTCKAEEYWTCSGCPPGTGIYVVHFENCTKVVDLTCTPTLECPGMGPIDPEPDLGAGALSLPEGSDSGGYL